MEAFTSPKLAALILALSRGANRAARRLLEEALVEHGLEKTAEWILLNDIAYKVYLLASEAGLEELAARLEERANQVVEAARYTAELMKAVDEVFTRNGVNYTVFKTFNAIGRIDIDIDLIIEPRSYWKAVRLLYRELGLKPIDSIEKTYATGFMAPRNPIVLDLHTELTVLGVPYIDNNVLLENNVRREYELPGGYVAEAYVATPIADTIARIGHALIKEAEIKVDDVTETLPVLTQNASKVKELLLEQAIPEAYPEFLSALANVLRGRLTPLRLNRSISVELLVKRVVRRRRLQLLLEAVYNLRYPRNAAHIGHLALAAIAR